MKKAPQAFRTISEVSDWLETPTHVLRFWESKFKQIKPVKRAGGRRYYRPDDMLLLGGIKHLLHVEGHTIKAVQQLIAAEGVKTVQFMSDEMDFPKHGEKRRKKSPAHTKKPAKPSDNSPNVQQINTDTAPDTSTPIPDDKGALSNDTTTMTKETPPTSDQLSKTVSTDVAAAIVKPAEGTRIFTPKYVEPNPDNNPTAFSTNFGIDSSDKSPVQPDAETAKIDTPVAPINPIPVMTPEDAPNMDAVALGDTPAQDPVVAPVITAAPSDSRLTINTNRADLDEDKIEQIEDLYYRLRKLRNRMKRATGELDEMRRLA